MRRYDHTPTPPLARGGVAIVMLVTFVPRGTLHSGAGMREKLPKGSAGISHNMIPGCHSRSICAVQRVSLIMLSFKDCICPFAGHIPSYPLKLAREDGFPIDVLQFSSLRDVSSACLIIGAN
ncbi:hypothetical protein BOTBODRAFT_30826, partial [Botryobasidium botryosum FD-172 SS1]